MILNERTIKTRPQNATAVRDDFLRMSQGLGSVYLWNRRGAGLSGSVFLIRSSAAHRAGFRRAAFDGLLFEKSRRQLGRGQGSHVLALKNWKASLPPKIHTS
jgi:hypothetical protein